MQGKYFRQHGKNLLTFQHGFCSFTKAQNWDQIVSTLYDTMLWRELDQLILLETTAKASKQSVLPRNVKRIIWRRMADIEPALSYDLSPFTPDPIVQNSFPETNTASPSAQPGTSNATAASASTPSSKNKKKKKKKTAKVRTDPVDSDADLPDLEPVDRDRKRDSASTGGAKSSSKPAEKTAPQKVEPQVS